MNFDISELVWALCGVYAIFSGLTKFKDKDAYKYKYTAESLIRFAKTYKICMCIIGVIMLWGAVIKLLGLPYLLTLINIVALIIAGVIVFIAYKKILREK